MAGRRRGFSFLELLVVLMMLAVLVALLLPAVLATNEAARRRACQSHLAQLVLAVHNYEMAHGVYPPGTIEPRGPILNWPRGYHASWLVQILPMIEYEQVQRRIDFRVGVYDPKNAAVRRMNLELLQCPSGDRIPARNDYAAVHHDREAPIDQDNNGVFFLNSRVRHEQVSDGLSQTIFLGEIMSGADDLGWMSGTRATLRNTDWSGAAFVLPVFPQNSDGLPILDEPTQRSLLLSPTPDEMGASGEGASGEGAGEASGSPKPRKALLFVGGFSSPHPGGSQFAMGDGSVRFLSSTVDPTVYQRLGNRRDGRPGEDP